MKKLLITPVVILAAGFSVFTALNYNNNAEKAVTNETQIVKQEARPAAQYWHEVLQNQETGQVTTADFKKSLNAVLAKKKADANTKASTLEWQSLGPNNVAGRSRTLVFDNQDSTGDTYYTGSVTGGLWKTTDGAGNWRIVQSSVSPTNVGDPACTNICSMTQTADGTLFLGTGTSFEFIMEDPGVGNGANIGTGLFKLAAGSNDVVLIPGTEDFTKSNAMAAKDNIVYVASAAAGESGLYYSVDGNSFTRVSGTSGTAYDVRVGPNGTVYAAMGSNLYRSTDGTNFEVVQGFADLDLPSRRKVITISESDPNTVYVGSIMDAASCDLNIYRTQDGGATWSMVVDGNSFVTPVGIPSGNCQGTYDLCIAVDPSDPSRIFFGGLTLWAWSDATGPYQMSNYFDFLGSSAYIHPDKHYIAFHPNNPDNMFVVNDGGVYETKDASSLNPAFQPSNKGLNITQFYDISAGQDGSVIGGSQDNGTSLVGYDFQSQISARDVNGGDGGYCEISNIYPAIAFSSSNFGNIGLSASGGLGGFGNFLNSNGAGKGPDEDGDGLIDGGNGDSEEAYLVYPFNFWEDTELYYKITSFKATYDADGNPTNLPATIDHNGQTFFITNDLEYVSTFDYGTPANLFCHGNNNSGDACYYPEVPNSAQPSQPGTAVANYGAYLEGKINPYAETFLNVAYDVITDQVVPSNAIVRSKFAIGNANGDMWMTYDALDLGATPYWVKLGDFESSPNNADDAGGRIASIAFSPNGDHVYFGTGNGRVVRTSNLNGRSGIEPKDPVSTTVAGGRFISGISVNPIFSDQVGVVCGNQGNSQYIYISQNANASSPTYTSAQGDLPPFPLFDLEIVGGATANDIVVGGEFGVYYGTGNGIVYSWTEAGGNPEDETLIGQVPVTTVDFEYMSRGANPADYLECKVLYIGTHGRGMFRSTSITPSSCDAVVALPDFAFDSVGEQEISSNSIEVYPNPTANFLNIDIETSDLVRAKINIFDVQGRLVKQVSDMAVLGVENLRVDLTDLPAGNYVVSLFTQEEIVSKKITVIR